mgnify:CR=1 FL=1
MEAMRKDGFMIVGLIILISAFVIGALSIRFLGNDNKVEEVAESVVEDVTEDFLKLDNDELKDKIDFSYNSKEK